MLGALLPLVAWPILHACAQKPPVNVGLRTSWPSSPLLLECLECVAIEDPAAFFPVLHAVTDPETLGISRTPQNDYQHVFNAARALDYLAQPGAHVAAEMHVALHSASPKLEAFYQYYSDHQAMKHDAKGVEGCESWVDWYGEVVCDVKTLARLVETHSLDAPENTAPPSTVAAMASPRLLSFDHILPEPSTVLEPTEHTVILYANTDSPNFRDLHAYLYAAATELIPRTTYVFRPIPPVHRDSSDRAYLSGYGVALDLKKMDYLAVDDRLQGGAAHKEDLKHADLEDEEDPIVALLQQYPMDESVDVTLPLTEQEFLDIDIQAAQLIYGAEDKLATLRHLAQNFPRYAGALSRRVPISSQLFEEIAEKQNHVRGGMNLVWLNGVSLEEKDLTPLSLLRLIRRERSNMQSLMSLGLSSEEAIRLLTHNTVARSQSSAGGVDGLFDASDRVEGGRVIGWLNDLETDERYARWGNTLRIVLRQMYPGQFPSLKYNLWNAILAVDMSKLSSTHFISVTVQALINRGLAFHWGIVPLVETDEAARMARLFYHLLDKVGPEETFAFLYHLSQVDTDMEDIDGTAVNWKTVTATYQQLLARKRDLADPLESELEAILAGTEGDLDHVRAYAKRLSLDAADNGHAFMNGKHFDLDDNILQSFQQEAMQQLQHVQMKVYQGQLSDEHAAGVSTYFYDLPTTGKRRNVYIYPSSKPGSLRIFSLPELIGGNGLSSAPQAFVNPVGEGSLPITTYLVADFDTPEGVELAKQALMSITPESVSRLSFIHNPATVSPRSTSDKSTSTSHFLARLVVKGALSQVAPERLSAELAGTYNDAFPEAPAQVYFTELTGTEVFSDKEHAGYLAACHRVVQDLGLTPGEQAIVVNGRVVGPLKSGVFVADDFDALAAYEFSKRTEPVRDALLDVYAPLKQANRTVAAELVSVAASIVSSIQLPDASEAGLFNAPLKPRSMNYRLLQNTYSGFKIGDESAALFHFGVIIDPLSEAAQMWSALFEWLQEMPGVYIDVHLNPTRYNELPLKRFYRYNLSPRLVFDEHGLEVKTTTKFTELPIEPIYTLAMDTPQSWLIRPREALYDLDNIQLAKVPVDGIKAIFDLDYLVIEGHARERPSEAAPRGLQMQLVTSDGTPIADTLVMANLGYLQFRTTPGVYRLETRPGRGRDIFEMESVGNQGWESPTVGEAGDEVTVTSFEGVTLYPRLVRRPGMEAVDVLLPAEKRREDEEDGLLDNVFSKMSSWFGGSKEEEVTTVVSVDDGQAEINIFTVASGHLYERFASIMILSVLRHTNSTVKFWFIENFLSPSFLEFIPHFAAEYRFQYELVTYKWPSWLRAQTEKQRIIWAYKILFLDVLFPMDLKKVIFVDADQIVRADLKELVGLDLHGAPYGYTPMGDDNPDTEGFRFWKTGYWHDFLRGMPYHISALYVVDLDRFREVCPDDMYDMLRGHYQALSADPNSLANLDQDLPNNLQREVPIFSLPEDWLWCETWCNKDRLHRAKTIDLCQNPLTKEPKLDRARQIPEWEVYDSEIAEFARKCSTNTQDGSRDEVVVRGHDEL
ncbi:glycosyltransferase family 24 protein [Epithele typhae]|uniref:glycosyltransferase family 24 protein n=1 Tax=Epithele typhae TaxID=378194 RepID=UPI002007CB23|nr:glycosyltransferase family 24 protein [Epithele typhae]KAH9946426.1 glycosyltransferase family 24 protein [Epithele typhae]